MMVRMRIVGKIGKEKGRLVVWDEGREEVE